ncbi:PQQ-dependent sugar dehydrogenase [Rheinheimera sp. SA_1]|uniref:PQQ-dependent sugar dehydrogenase n=1 Tax=Rheinheimera sp. SA_1 TaxID=1827365 RepID=UPI000B31A747|nr:sorbosone dehydrogenase family protein [Rheinheimera sp. SA_1]
MELSVRLVIKHVMKLVMTLFSAKNQQLLAKARQPKAKTHHQDRPFIANSKGCQAIAPVGAGVEVGIDGYASACVDGYMEGAETRPLVADECAIDTCYKQMRHWRDLAGFLPPAILCAAMLSGCSDTGSQPISQSTGLNPALPAPQHALIPTVKIAPAIGWPAAKKPVAAPGTKVTAFAQGLDHPRWLYLLPNGDVLVAETNSPAKPDDATGFIGWMMGLVMKRAGATVPSANQIRLLRDTNGDGVADLQTIFLAGLNSPFGMALVDGNIYIANSDAIMRFAYQQGDTQITTAGSQIIALPAGTINHHWTKNIIASRDGRSLFVTVGSNSNVGERGMAEETERAAIWKVDRSTGTYRVFASGLRNPNGMAWEPLTGVLWTVVNERDELGNDLVPDYLTSVQDGGFYGWPYSYFGPNVDSRVEPPRPDLVTKAIIPDYALGAHTAPLGLAASTGNSLPAVFANGMFVGQHGSWNRNPPSGYKVIFVPFNQGQPYGQPIDVLTGFLSDNGDAYGRPVGVALDATGALLVADDVGNMIWRVSKAASP